MLPKPVYEILPLLYIAGGTATIISSVNSIIAIISGTLLASAGIVIFFMRRRNRRSYCKLEKPGSRLTI